MNKIKFAFTGCLILLGTVSTNAQSSEDIPAVKKNINSQQKTTPAVVQENRTGTLGTQKPTVITAATKAEAKQPAVNSTNTGLKIAAATKEETMTTGLSSIENAQELKPAAKPVTTSTVSETAVKVAPASPIFNRAFAPGTNTELLKPVETNTSSAAQMPEVKLDSNPAPVKIEEVPASVVNPEIKKPEVSKQGTKGKD